jgi:hypothetical protein
MDSNSIFNLFQGGEENRKTPILNDDEIIFSLEEDILVELQILCKKVQNWEYIFNVIEDSGIKGKKEQHIKFNEFCYKHIELIIHSEVEDIYNAILLDNMGFVEIIFPMAINYLWQLNEQLENYEKCAQLKDLEENLKVMWLFKKATVPSQ